MERNHAEQARVLAQLESVEARYEELSIRITLPEVIADTQLFAKLMREHSDLAELNEIAKEFSKDVVVIGISDEPVEKIKAMKEPVIEYYYGVDTKKTMDKILEIKGIPHVIIIDPKGIVRWEGFPLLENHKLTPEVVKNLIEKYK